MWADVREKYFRSSWVGGTVLGISDSYNLSYLEKRTTDVIAGPKVTDSLKTSEHTAVLKCS